MEATGAVETGCFDNIGWRSARASPLPPGRLQLPPSLFLACSGLPPVPCPLFIIGEIISIAELRIVHEALNGRPAGE